MKSRYNLSLNRTLQIGLGLLVVLTMILAACSPAAAPTAAPQATVAATEPPTPVPTEAPTEAVATEDMATPAGVAVAEPTINVVDDPDFGEILVDGEGMTLYIFTKDEPDKVNCAGECLEKWPPLLTEGSPTLGEGVDAALVGTADMPDGTKIVTYNHMPLYYWWKDAKAGDTDGQGVGEVWYVISPAGEMIKTAVADSATPAATAQPAAAAGEATVNVVDDPNFGEILVDGEGMTLYIFTKDEPDKVNCAGECLEKWPPLLTEGNPTLGEGIDPAMVGTADMPDGTKIVTYNHMPLYYWWEDAKAGDTSGQDVGGVWYVISPAGEMIKTAPADQGTPASTAAPAAAAGEATINVVNDPELGEILVDGNGMTLYMFTKDTADKSNCDAACLEKWPPLLTEGNPTLGEGVDASLVGFAELADGSKIVTYNHMPLYLWVKDTKAGDTTGQGVGEVWYVVAPDGSVVGLAQPQSTPAPAGMNDNSDKEDSTRDSDY